MIHWRSFKWVWRVFDQMETSKGSLLDDDAPWIHTTLTQNSRHYWHEATMFRETSNFDWNVSLKSKSGVQSSRRHSNCYGDKDNLLVNAFRDRKVINAIIPSFEMKPESRDRPFAPLWRLPRFKFAFRRFSLLECRCHLDLCMLPGY